MKQSWKVWIFVICLNIFAFVGAVYLKSIGIDVFALRATSQFVCVRYDIKNLKSLFKRNKMKNKFEIKWKQILDTILIYNLYILIIGSIVLIIGFALSVNGNLALFNLFQRLWYPVFIPSLSLFFTAILVEAIYSRFIDGKKNKNS